MSGLRRFFIHGSRRTSLPSQCSTCRHYAVQKTRRVCMVGPTPLYLRQSTVYGCPDWAAMPTEQEVDEAYLRLPWWRRVWNQKPSQSSRWEGKVSGFWRRLQ